MVRLLHRLRRIYADKYAEDVFRARLKTIGVCEYKFEMESGFESGNEWRIIDVGGSRSQVCRTHSILVSSLMHVCSDVSVLGYPYLLRNTNPARGASNMGTFL